MAVTVCVGMISVPGCQQQMADQGRLEPLEASEFFADGRAARPFVQGTVARGHLKTDTSFYEGRSEGQEIARVPVDEVARQLRLQGTPQEIRLQLLYRGQERFHIFCAPCHDRAGTGSGMVVQRGFPSPPSLHLQRLREVAPGHLFQVISEGLGRMPAHADQIPAVDRWTIVAYVQALQLSQSADVGLLSDADRAELTERSAAE